MYSYKTIKKYNQFLIAIGGTLLIFFFIISFGFYISSEFRYLFHSKYEHQNGIIATEETDKLLNDSLRKQIISFEKISVIDSIDKIYLLPVTHAHLENKESIEDMNGLMNSTYGYSTYYEEDKSYYDFNNLAIYNSKDEISDIVFKKRINISDYKVLEINGKKYLIILATNIDSNKNGFFSGNDIQQLYLYDIKAKTITLIKTNKHLTTLDIYEEQKTKEVICKLGLDRNKNGQFESYEEPVIFYKLDIKNKLLVKVIKEKQIDILQNLLEGK